MGDNYPGYYSVQQQEEGVNYEEPAVEQSSQPEQHSGPIRKIIQKLIIPRRYWVPVTLLLLVALFLGVVGTTLGSVALGRTETNGDKLDDLTSEIGGLTEEFTSDDVYDAGVGDRKNQKPLLQKGRLEVHGKTDLRGVANLHAGGTVSGADLVLDGVDITSTDGNFVTTTGESTADTHNDVVSIQPLFPNGGNITRGDIVGLYGSGVTKGYEQFTSTEFAENIATNNLQVVPLGVGETRVALLYINTATKLAFKIADINTSNGTVTLYTTETVVDATAFGGPIAPWFFAQPLSGHNDKFVIGWRKPSDGLGTLFQAYRVTAVSPAVTTTSGAVLTIRAGELQCINDLKRQVDNYFVTAFTSPTAGGDEINFQGLSVNPTSLAVTTVGAADTIADAKFASVCGVIDMAVLSDTDFVFTFGGNNIGTNGFVQTASVAAGVVTIEDVAVEFWAFDTSLFHQVVRITATSFAIVFRDLSDSISNSMIYGSIDSLYVITLLDAYAILPFEGQFSALYNLEDFEAIEDPASGDTDYGFILCMRGSVLQRFYHACQYVQLTSDGDVAHLYEETPFTEIFAYDVYGLALSSTEFLVVYGINDEVPNKDALVVMGSLDRTDHSIDFSPLKPREPYGIALESCSSSTACPTGTKIQVLIRGKICDSSLYTNTRPGYYFAHGDGTFTRSSRAVSNSGALPVRMGYGVSLHCVRVWEGFAADPRGYIG